jgi:peptidoglycan hydrolase-like protein with peptidoglycan-binding domain
VCAAEGERQVTSAKRAVLGTGALVTVVAGAAVALGFGGETVAPPPSDLPPATTTVTRQTLVDEQDKEGILAYGREIPLSPRQVGTATWLPAVGTVIKRGEAAYRLNDLPVVLMYGPVPAYRDLAVDVEGADVRQLEENLRQLGLTGFAVDDKYTDGTAAAVKKWQKDNGLAQTGAVQLGQVVFVPGEIRVAATKSAVGEAAQPGQTVLTYTGTAQVVTVSLDLGQQRLAIKDAAVTVTLPDGKAVPGTITSVATVIEPATESAKDSTKIDVTVSFVDKSAMVGFDRATVTVGFTAAQRKDVLTVPVAALLALTGGGYGLEVVEGTSRRIVPIEVGLFSGGRVEVSGSGLSTGMTVGVPA